LKKKVPGGVIREAGALLWQSHMGKGAGEGNPLLEGRESFKICILEMHSCAFSVTKGLFWEAPYT